MVVDLIVTGVMQWWMQLVLVMLVGMAAFFMLPPLATIVDAFPYGPNLLSRKVSRFHQGLARNLAEGWVLIVRSHGGVTLRGAEFDPERGTGMWIVRMGGEEKYFNDPNGMMGTWRGKPFGIADEEKGVIVSPPQIDLGNKLRSMADDRRLHITEQVEQRMDNGQTVQVPQHYVAGVVPVSKASGLLQLHGARAIIQGDASPGVVEMVNTIVEQMFSLYDSSPAVQYIMWIGSIFAGGAFLWLLLKLNESLSADAGGQLPSAGLTIVTGVPA